MHTSNTPIHLNLDLNLDLDLTATSNNHGSNHTAMLAHNAQLSQQPNHVLAVQTLVPSIHQAAAYCYEATETLANIYQNKQKGYTYARTGSPNTQDLEKKITLLEDAHASVAFTTGMAAYANLFFVLLKAGTHVLASQHLFANSVSLLKSYEKFGVEVEFLDCTPTKNANNALGFADTLAQKIRQNTVMLLVETIANPCTQIPDWASIQAVLSQHPQVILVVDNTLTTPYGFKPKTIGAHLIVHSLTKAVMGHSRGLGGIVVDTGLMNWQNHPLIQPVYQTFAKDAFVMQLRKKGLRDMGATLSPQHADLAALGLETLAMRIDKAQQNALQVANYLHQHPAVKSVLHPCLEDHAQHKLALTHYRYQGCLLTFSLQELIPSNNLNSMNATQLIARFLSHLNVIKHCSSLGDNRSLIIHVASTIFAELNETERLAMGITPTTLRLSIGIEDAKDLIQALQQALEYTY